MGTKGFGDGIKRECPGWHEHLSRETPSEYFLDLSDCIVKRFPKGYILHNYALQRFTTDKECWVVVKDCGKTEDGLFYFLAFSSVLHNSMQDGIDELQYLRRRFEG